MLIGIVADRRPDILDTARLDELSVRVAEGRVDLTTGANPTFCTVFFGFSNFFENGDLITTLVK
jgi:hypothetical protein